MARTIVSAASERGLALAIQEASPRADALQELARICNSLNAILQLHFSQEEELYHSAV